jgi:hypothetical protein
MQIDIEIKDQAVQDMLTYLGRRGASLKPAMKEIGEIVRNSILRNFMEGGRPEKWLPTKILSSHRGAAGKGKKIYRLHGSRPVGNQSGQDKATLIDIQRAVRFYYLLKAGYGSRIPNPTFSISTMSRSSFNLLRIEEELSAAHLRLSRVYVENMHYETLIKRFDRPHTFFYLDPPYYDCEDYYGKGIFSREDFRRLADLLKEVEGKFILSINDVPEIRSLFADFCVKEATTTYTLPGAHEKKKVTELLIMNFIPAEQNLS